MERILTDSISVAQMFSTVHFTLSLSWKPPHKGLLTVTQGNKYVHYTL